MFKVFWVVNKNSIDEIHKVWPITAVIAGNMTAIKKVTYSDHDVIYDGNEAYLKISRSQMHSILLNHLKLKTLFEFHII